MTRERVGVGPAAGPLRRALDRVYIASGLLAGAFLAGIAVAVIAQIVGRFVGSAIDGTELAGFCMAASTFLGLAYTLKSGTHVRVTLVTRCLPAGVKRVVEVACSLVGLAASVYFTVFAVKLVLQSWRFGDVSPGLIAAPFWIPQSGMALGGALLVVAFLDEFAIVASGGRAGYETEEGVLDAAAESPAGGEPASAGSEAR